MAENQVSEKEVEILRDVIMINGCRSLGDLDRLAPQFFSLDDFKVKKVLLSARLENQINAFDKITEGYFQSLKYNDRIKPITEVYEQFKYTDKNIMEVNDGSRPLERVCRDLWVAIKKVL